MVIKRKQKTCYDCKHYIVATDRDEYKRGEKENIIYECVNDSVDFRFTEKYNWNPEKMGKKCQHFEARTYTEQCPICESEFQFKQPYWHHWVCGDAVCSTECAEKGRDEKDELTPLDIEEAAEEKFGFDEDDDFEVPF